MTYRLLWLQTFVAFFFLCLSLSYLRQCDAALPLISNEEYLALLAQHENDEQAISSSDIVALDIYTSFTYLAETNDTISATFVGDFAVSGPHALGTFPIRGSHKHKVVTLSRKIGRLVGIYLENKVGSDGWLLRYLTAQIDNVISDFVFSDPLTWLSNLDATSQSYDTEHQQIDMPVVPLLYLPVKNEVIDYSATGN